MCTAAKERCRIIAEARIGCRNVPVVDLCAAEVDCQRSSLGIHRNTNNSNSLRTDILYPYVSKEEGHYLPELFFEYWNENGGGGVDQVVVPFRHILDSIGLHLQQRKPLSFGYRSQTVRQQQRRQPHQDFGECNSLSLSFRSKHSSLTLGSKP